MSASDVPSLLQATIRTIAPAIPDADNVGRTGDRRDLYWLIDYMAYAVDQAYAGHPCGRGCADCCRNQLFRVSEPEWERLREGLAAAPFEVRAGILARAQEVYGPRREVLEALAAAWTAGERPDPAWHQAAPRVCPVLGADGRCSLYDERPAICRAFGAFSATVEGTSSVLICHQHGPAFLDGLAQAGTVDLTLPNWNPVQRRLQALAPGGMIKPLPLWLLEWPEEDAPCSA
ncbi:MAG: YkgJ family cysteine cluster protein [Candidatus Sericytochromatia bacterium]|nr:YkgJ family cysteine cluster protein [Candidatus Sericytochromatia bacterium]